MILTLTFRRCTVRADLISGYTETVFDDGAKVPAYPAGTPEQAATARELGYGDDVPRMCREHEVLHTWLCERFDLPYSPTLWTVAHGEDAPGAAPLWARLDEESLVLAFQRYLNGGDIGAPLASLTNAGRDLGALRREALALLRPEICTPAAA